MHSCISIMQQILLCVAAVLIQCAASSRILLIPGQLPEDIYVLHSIGQQLLAAGHRVDTVLAHNTDKNSIYLPIGLDIVTYTTPDDVSSFTSEQWSVDQLSPIKSLQDKYISYAIKTLHTQHCTAILDNHDLLKRIRSSHYDLAVVHGSAHTRCHFIIAYACGLPFVYVSSHVELSVSRIPVMPSFVPHYEKPYTTYMSFSERVLNLIAYMKPDLEFWQDTSMLKKYKKHIDLDVTEMHDLLRKSSLFLITTDHLLDWPTPAMPHLMMQRGITLETEPPAELSSVSKELTAAASSSKGIIIISLGIVLDVYPQVIIDSLSTLSEEYQIVVFQQRLQKKILKSVYFAYKNRRLAFSADDTKLLITSGNNEDQSEALYYGIPVLTIPLYGNQMHNARRLEQRELGSTIQLSNKKLPKTSDVISAVDNILNNGDIKERAVKMSVMMQAAPKGHWMNSVEHILQFGDSHIRSIALDLPLHQYAMLDMLAIVCVIAIFTFSIISRIFLCILRFVVSKVFFLVITIMVGVVRLLFRIVTLGKKAKED